MDIENYFVQVYATNTWTFRLYNGLKSYGMSRTKFKEMSY
jgi:hypothetical protein